LKSAQENIFDLLGDPYEGHYTRALIDGEAEHIRAMLRNPAIAELPNAEAQVRAAFDAMREFPKRIRAEMFVSCWHMNEEESWAMWKLYTSHDESICVRSTYQTLAEALPDVCYLGQIKYIDYRHDFFDPGNLLNYIIHKRKSFEHEHEARAVISKTPDLSLETIGNEGLVVPINIRALVKEIFVSPASKPMLREIVEGLATKYGVTAPVRQSSVNDPPGY
jgi:hypothetical protein